MNTCSIAKALIVASAALALSVPAHAADGIIDFTGSITTTTCVVNGGGSAASFSVALPPVATTSLVDAGTSAGRTGFQIEVTGCDVDAGKISAYFEAGPSVNAETGNLIPDETGVTNVEIALRNADLGKIVLGAAGGLQNSQFVDPVDGVATLNYYAEYESLGAATAGEVSTRVQYTMVYQ